MAIPAFVVGIGLSLVFGVRLRWLPANGYVTPGESVAGWLSHLGLAGDHLGLVQGAVLVRYVRSAFIVMLNQDWFPRLGRSAGAVGLRCCDTAFGMRLCSS